jgi:hypothetical protein
MTIEVGDRDTYARTTLFKPMSQTSNGAKPLLSGRSSSLSF